MPDACQLLSASIRSHDSCCVQVIAEVSMEQDDDADYDRKLSQLKREEELINEEAKEAAAFLQTDIPVIRPGQVPVCN